MVRVREELVDDLEARAAAPPVHRRNVHDLGVGQRRVGQQELSGGDNTLSGHEDGHMPVHVLTAQVIAKLSAEFVKGQISVAHG